MLEDQVYKTLLQYELEALRALAGADHILQFYDKFSTKNNTYIITELCDSDLARYLKERKTLQLVDALPIIVEILEGYMQVHRIGYVHRDLKPANIFLSAGRCKIADFGFAVPIA